ncbi:hypothetical protein BD410DRAFT_109396 [Rickenella mellea]|uniref:Uncharacterized protein n=1 Tax=Rickenella mellea TaxID=50990 RepID=A0A4Y7Q9K0_9AGAM|nr:hypothetical protein BD410DRAFT_109396 [Rickenella mellea]
MRASLRSIIMTTFIAYAFILPLVSAIARNHTIDDVFGDDNSGALPTYSPGTAWHRGDQCTACLVKPDASQAFNGTWHDATHNVADTQPVFMDISYNGSAIYVYGILANHIPSTTTATNLTFTLDGAVVGTFVHVPDNSSNFVYNVPFYANSSVPLGEHTLHIESNAVTQSALVLFDYAVYTIDDDTTSTSSSATSSPSTTSTTPTVSSTSKPTGSSTSTPTISPTPSHTPSPLPSKSNNAAIAIGATFGTIVLLALLLAFLYLKFARRYMYRRRGRQTPSGAPHAAKSMRTNLRLLVLLSYCHQSHRPCRSSWKVMKEPSVRVGEMGREAC